MVNIGDIVLSLPDGERRLPLLTVRQMATMQNALGARLAREAVEDAKAAGLGSEEILKAAREARQHALLTSTLLRSCFEIGGALAILAEAVGSREEADSLAQAMTPDECTQAALQLLGFEWDAPSGKWRSRSRESGPATA